MQLSCNRILPCQRCVRSGRPGQCSFETETGQPYSLNQLTQQQAQCSSDENRDLRAEVTRLKELLSKTRIQQNEGGVETLTTTACVETGQAVVVLLNGEVEKDQRQNVISDYLSDPRDRSPRGYYSQHTLLQFFREVSGHILCVASQSCLIFAIDSTTIPVR